MRDFDDNGFPLAYLITFRCYGTWLHGDPRGSTDRKHNVYKTLRIAQNPRLQEADRKQMKSPPETMDARRRAVVESAMREVCRQRRYVLRAINVRTNHVHSVVSANQKPEPILNAFKAYSSRALRKAGLIPETGKPWARHGSTIYLWKESDVAKGVEYVLLGQGGDLLRPDDE
jgi:REP element-mobilizing transposase RayT